MLNYILRFSHDRDVVIKLVWKGDQGRTKYEILRLLNSAPLHDHPRNSTVPVSEFIECEDCYFVVMLFCDGCDEIPFRNAAEVLDFAEQVLSVDSCLFWFMEIFTTIYEYRDYVSCTIIAWPRSKRSNKSLDTKSGIRNHWVISRTEGVVIFQKSDPMDGFRPQSDPSLKISGTEVVVSTSDVGSYGRIQVWGTCLTPNRTKTDVISTRIETRQATLDCQYQLYALMRHLARLIMPARFQQAS